MTQDPTILYDRLRSLSVTSERLQTLDSLFLKLSDVKNKSESLQIQTEDFYHILSSVSDSLETKSRESGDPEIWKETAVLIDLLDKMIRPVSVSLSVFSKDLESKETEILDLFLETSSHYLEDMIDIATGEIGS